MTITAAALADATFRDRPAISIGRVGSQLARQLLLGTAAVATVGVGIAGVTLAAGWLLSRSPVHGDLPRSNLGLRQIALVPPYPELVKTASPADIVVFPPSVADVARPTHVAERTPLPLVRPRVSERPPTVPLPPAIPEALASLRSTQKLASVEPSPAPIPPPAPQPAAAPPHAEKPPLPKLADGRTAVYDIASHMVYLPNGKTLEAHSGLGDWRDDPDYVRMKNRGPTPPNTYDLSLREALFHGVRAIRLTPVNDDKMFGRDGMLAHTYMMGPGGDSNGCVSFKDYRAFLQAYLKGDVNRLVVVARHGATLAGVARGGANRDARYAVNDAGPSSPHFSAAGQ